MLRLLIVADDLTGALDAAGPFASRGLATWCLAQPDAPFDPDVLPDLAVLTVNTESRHLSASAAAQRVRDAWQRVDGRRFDVVVKKIDSTMRGQVVAEIAALRRAAGRPGVVCSTAFPAQGRIVVNGEVYVHGERLERTAFATDALSPAMTVPLRRALDAAGVGDLVVHDAIRDAQIDVVARERIAMGRDCVLAGSAGLTAALARAWPNAPGARTALRLVAADGPALVVIGSRAQAARAQADALAAAGAAVIEAPDGQVPEAALADARAGEVPRDIVLLATRGSDGAEADALAVAASLASSAVELARRIGAVALVATGGDTAVALLRATGQSLLPVAAELLPGIAVTRLELDGRALPLVTKAGGFGGADALVQAVDALRASRDASPPGPHA